MQLILPIILMAALMSPASLTQPKVAPDTRNISIERAIEDNSFLIEEAYNQEEGVVQHISSFAIFPNPSREIEFTFTQEWPLFAQDHQLSYSLGYFGADGSGGIGDILVNYRFQAFGSEEWAAVAPRISVLLRTGKGIAASGSKVAGWQFNIPVSKRLSSLFTAHLNAGLTLEPGFEARLPNESVESRTLTSFNVGASLIWLPTPHFNILTECLFTSSERPGDDAQSARSGEWILSPGARYAADMGALQIVPGIAIPFRISDGDLTVGAFFYLSFEHPF